MMYRRRRWKVAAAIVVFCFVVAFKWQGVAAQQERLTAVKAATQEAQSQHEKAKEERDRLLKDMKLKETELEKFEEKRAEEEGKLTEAEDKRTKAEAKRIEAEGKLTEADAKLTKADAKLTEADAKRTEAEAKRTEAEDNLTEAERKLTKIRESIKEEDKKRLDSREHNRVSATKFHIDQPENSIRTLQLPAGLVGIGVGNIAAGWARLFVFRAAEQIKTDGISYGTMYNKYKAADAPDLKQKDNKHDAIFRFVLKGKNYRMQIENRTHLFKTDTVWIEIFED